MQVESVSFVVTFISVEIPNEGLEKSLQNKQCTASRIWE